MLPVEQDGPCPQEDDALGRVVGESATWSVVGGIAAGLAAQTTTGRTCGGSPREAQTCSEGYSSGYVQAATTSPTHHQDTGWEKEVELSSKRKKPSTTTPPLVALDLLEIGQGTASILFRWPIWTQFSVQC